MASLRALLAVAALAAAAQAPAAGAQWSEPQTLTLEDAVAQVATRRG